MRAVHAPSPLPAEQFQCHWMVPWQTRVAARTTCVKLLIFFVMRLRRGVERRARGGSPAERLTLSTAEGLESGVFGVKVLGGVSVVERSGAETLSGLVVVGGVRGGAKRRRVRVGPEEWRRPAGFRKETRPVGRRR